jgi:serine/threonine protein kinase
VTGYPAVPGYEVLEAVGEGGQGTVFRACDSSGRIVALKFLPAAQANGQSTIAIREWNSLTKLQDHPNVIGLLDQIRLRDYVCLVLTWCDGGVVGVGLPPERVARYGVLLCGALITGAHYGILHGDLKPDNVLVDSLGQPRLADYGVAAIPGRRGSGLTPAYAAPERASLHNPDELTEQFSLARTLLEICDPFQLSNTPALGATLARGADRNRATRFPSLIDFAQALREVEVALGCDPTTPIVPAQITLPAPPRPSKVPTPGPTRFPESVSELPKHNRAIGVKISVLMFVVGATGIGFLLRSKSSSENSMAKQETVVVTTSSHSPTTLSSAGATTSTQSQDAGSDSDPASNTNSLLRDVTFVVTSGQQSALQGAIKVDGLPVVTSGSEHCLEPSKCELLVATVVVRNDRRVELIGIAGRSADTNYVEWLEGKSPAVSPNGTSVAFSKSSERNRDIYLADENGGNVRKLTTASTDDDQPTWVSDSEIVWVSNEVGSSELFKMNVDTGERSRLTTTGTWSDPSGDPRSGKVVAVQRRDGQTRISTVDGADGKEVPIVGSENGRSPIWRSADTLSYVKSLANTSPELVTVNVLTNDEKRLPLPPGTSILVRPSSTK